ncbi:MAG: hypothetical protein IPL26_19810 [Leptospiraceae bacterium]|nr:hypothetical protein [Leptospiraceae bacterium]
MAKIVIRNKRDVSDQILAKFGTIEKFADESGLAYEMILDGLISTGLADPEVVTALQENGISVET